MVSKMSFPEHIIVMVTHHVFTQLVTYSVPNCGLILLLVNNNNK